MNIPAPRTAAAPEAEKLSGDMELDVVHETHYDYDSTVSVAQHLAHLQPVDDADQRLLDFALHIAPQPSHQRDSMDAMGNAQCHFSLDKPHDSLCVRATSRVRLRARFAALQAEASVPWDQLSASLRYVALARLRQPVEYAMPSQYVPRLPELRDYAAASFPPGQPVAVGALSLMHRIYTDFKYESRSTEVDTPLSEVLTHRRGVCQDFAHLMVGCLRMLGLPARYVSGYLLTHAADSGEALLGADASHAWVQVWCPETPGVPADGWLGLDPTNDVVPSTSHVRLAVGRDFGDVTPLRGVIRSGGSHRLRVGVTTRGRPAAAQATAQATTHVGTQAAGPVADAADETGVVVATVSAPLRADNQTEKTGPP